MHLARIRLRGFRNHADTTLELGTGANVLAGDNGQGKTNIVEAISYLCLTKSFYASSDSLVLGFGGEAFEVVGELVSDSNVKARVRVSYLLGSREKVYTLNRRKVEPFSSVIGRFPLVILSPEHTPITLGPPAERRKFMDMVMSQSSVAYCEEVLDYRRVLKQRNKVLLEAKFGRSEADTNLRPWDEQIVSLGARLMFRRRKFVEEFQSYIVSSYRQVTDDMEEPAIGYVPATDVAAEAGVEEIAGILTRELAARRREEVRLGSTLVGPHRDELRFTINGLDLRKYASQGQHKTFLIALKMGEFSYLKELCRETPVVLLDDVFSELDERRVKQVLGLLGDLGQTVVTSTARNMFDEAMAFGDRNRKFLVAGGAVVYPEGLRHESV